MKVNELHSVYAEQLHGEWPHQPADVGNGTTQSHRQGSEEPSAHHTAGDLNSTVGISQSKCI